MKLDNTIDKFLCLATNFLIVVFLVSCLSKAEKNLSNDVFKDQILLNKEMLINEVGLGNVNFLVDEQLKPKPKTTWRIDEDKEWIYPISLVIDLGGIYDVSAIHFYDSNGKGLVKVSGGIPFQWKPYFEIGLDKYEEWNTQWLKQSTRFIRVILESREANINEIIVCGKLISKAVSKNIEQKKSLVKMNDFIGTNSFIDVPMDKIKPLNFIREYHSWNWMEGDNQNYEGYPKNKNQFSPTIAGDGWDFDKFYKDLFEKGYTVSPCLEGNVLWQVNDKKNFQHKPIFKGHKNPEAPSSYIAHADHLFQFAARYGSTKVSPNLLKLAANQTALSGLGWLKYYENWNEPDKWWEGRESYFSPYEYAAMCSADVDGHQKTMGSYIGIKNADPNSKLVMAGLATLNLSYLKAMIFWFKYHRTDYQTPLDVINFHHYSNNAHTEGAMSNEGISPERDSLYEKVSEIRKFCNLELPNKELWITEFGYDEMEKGRQIAKKIEGISREETQARWIIRTYLSLAAAGVNRAAQFMIRNAEEQSNQTYSHCGLTSSKETGYIPKKAWYYVYTMKEVLKNSCFEKLQRKNNIWICEFITLDKKSSIYAIWCGTEKNMVVKNFQLTLPKKYGKAKLIIPEHGKIKGLEKLLSLENNSIVFEISELPVFLVASQ